MLSEGAIFCGHCGGYYTAYCPCDFRKGGIQYETDRLERMERARLEYDKKGRLGRLIWLLRVGDEPPESYFLRIKRDWLEAAIERKRLREEEFAHRNA